MESTAAPAPTNNYRWQPGWPPAIFAFVIYSLIVIGTMKLSGVGYDEFTKSADNIFKSVVLSLALGSVFLVVLVTWLRWDFVWRDPGRLSMGKLLWTLPVLMVIGIIARLASVHWGDVDMNLVLGIFLAGVLVGFAEETLFRGIWLRSMRVGGRSEGHAAIFTTIAFGLFHLPNILIGGGAATFGQVFFAAATGFGLYLWRRGFGWIVPAMIIHGTWDMSSFITDFDRASTTSPGMIVAQVLFFVGLAVAVASIVVVWRRDKATFWQREGAGINPDAPLVDQKP
ncbi:MAG: CPBP family intramembrane metalloprotease [Thermoleophilaceae bacterium]|nr:CPBP family intramembrane metalloprotease [Thermoleophilaceae bacterium]